MSDAGDGPNWPRLVEIDRTLLPGLAAVGIFAVMAAVFLRAEFSAVAGFGDASTVTGIGYALIGTAESAGQQAVYEDTGQFLVAFILIAVLLDAALDGALMLARRDEGGED
jgi:NADH-quinone oxidoreductase subunit J